MHQNAPDWHFQGFLNILLRTTNSFYKFSTFVYQNPFMKILFSSFLGLFIMNSFAATGDNEQRVKAPVESVVIYLEGAEITQAKTVQLEAGRNTIIFTGISSKLISKSIQINAGPDASILSISDKINYLGTDNLSPKARQLKDSLKMLNDMIGQLNYEKEAFESEKELLAKNEALGGREKAVSIAELKLAADFYRSRIKEINAELFRIGKKTELYDDILDRVNNELAELNARENIPMAEISVLLSSNAKANVRIELKYLVGDAGWAPSYDLIAEDVNKPIEVKYRAKVFNNTDVDWSNVKMKLSTSDPSQNASKPQLAAWYLNFEDDYSIQNNYQQGFTYSGNSLNEVVITGKGNAAQYADAEGNTGNDAIAKIQVEKNSKVPPAYEEIQVSDLSAEFEIKNTYTIPADAKPYIVEVTNYNLPATFKHYSIPKTEKEAFLLAQISGWEQLNLVEGPANVYFGGSYVGQSYIYTRSLDDTLDLSFGRDKKVMVSRTRLKEYNSRSFSGTNKKETQSFEIVVKNNRKSPITIDVEDQLPVSQNSEIIVETIELSKAKKDDASGKLIWNYTIAPGEQQKITLTYSIRYPKNKVVRAKKYRKVRAARF
jgi:uncharacterized protein (TIGR02231 family)